MQPECRHDYSFLPTSLKDTVHYKEHLYDQVDIDHIDQLYDHSQDIYTEDDNLDPNDPENIFSCIHLPSNQIYNCKHRFLHNRIVLSL